MILADELKTDPLARGYASHLPDDPQRAVDLLTAPVFSMPNTITAGQALMWAATGPLASITDTSNNINSPLRSSCLAFLLAMKAGRDVHMEAANVRLQLDAWAQAGLITAQERDALVALATQPASRANIIGIPAPDTRDIINAWSSM